MLKNEFVTLSQTKYRNNKAKRYSQKCRQRQIRRRLSTAISSTFCLVLLFSTISHFSGSVEAKETNETTEIETEVETETEETQSYIVRFGYVDHFDENGFMYIITRGDGNIWSLIDAPEIERGEEVRMLFSTNNTENYLYDDKIVDIIEWHE